MKHKLALLFTCLAISSIALAQTGKLSGRLSGGQQDKSTIVIVLTSTAGGAVPVRIAVAPDGTFSTALPPGTYRVEIENAGRRQAATENLQIVSGSTAQMSVQVPAGAASETLEIQAEAPATEDDPPDVGRGYTTRTVRELPVPDRVYQELNGLMSGVTPPVVNPSRTEDPQRSRQYNTNGLPAYTNDNLTDGTSIREPFTGTFSVRVLPDEAVEQLNIRTSNYPADHGFGAGAITNVFTRPGTNGIHGSLFGFYTNDFFQARTGIVPAGQPQPPLHHWQYGASAGGSLIPDKMFAFLSYQGTREHGGTPEFATVPTAAMAAGNFSGLGVTLYNPATGTTAGAGRIPFGSTLPSGSINPASRAILAALPGPNLPGLANNLFANVPYADDANIGDAKIDYRFTDALTGFLRYGISHINSEEDSILGSIVGTPTRAGLRNHHGSLSLVGNYNGILGELRFGYSRYRNAITDVATGSDTLSRQLSASAFPSGVPSFSTEGVGLLGTLAGLPARDIDNLYEGAANFHAYRGGHQIKFGVDIRSQQSSGFQDLLFDLYGPRGGFLFGPGPASIAGAVPTANNIFAASVASFLLGAPTVGGVFNPSEIPNFHQMQYGVYISDTFHLGTRLAIDLGVRWDAYSPVETRHAFGATFYDPATNTVRSGSQLFNGDYDLNNFAPRFGAAYRITERTVFRAGYAINYFPLPFAYSGLNSAGQGLTRGVVGSLAATTFAVPTAPAITPGTTAVAAPNTPYYFPANSQTPYSHNYYLMIQQGLPLGFLFDISYVGNLGRQLPYFQQLNAAAPGTGLAGLPFASVGRTAGVTEIGQGVTSNYNSLQANITKQLSKGASFAVAYTYGKAMDYGTFLLNNFNRNANYGPADWDRQHMLTISHVFALPVGVGSPHWSTGVIGQVLANWELTGLFHWATGTPYTVVADPIACACPGVNVIPANPGSGSSSANGSAFVSPQLFSLPGPNSIGGIGRNSVRGPDLTNYNLALFKSFAVRENFKLELRGEAYNILNNTLFANPANNLSLTNFGQSSNLLNGMGGRLFMVGARVLF